MRYTILVALGLITNISFGQMEKSTNKVVTPIFVKHYNADDFEAIFLLFSDIMKETLPLNKATEFFTGLKSQAGNISKREFIKYDNGTFASYKTTFENAIFSVNISVDNNSKINGLLVKPFMKATPTEPLINGLSTAGNTITDKQSDIIFKSAQVFPNQTQIAIAIIKDGKVSYYGLKRNTDTLLTIENHKSIFEIGSITKVFTSTLFAGFVVDKKIELNGDINDHLNFSFNKDTKISFKELSNHTSGLPPLPSNFDVAIVDQKDPYKEYNGDDLENYLTNSLELSQNLRGKYQYSNLGVGLMGYTLCEIEGVDFDSLLKKNIFSKYDMPSTTTIKSKIKGTLVEGLDSEGNIVSNWAFSTLAGAGGILSNVEDLSNFAVAQFDSANKELALTRQKTFEINGNMNIGLGWHILKSKSNPENEWVWHNGGTGGYSSSMAIDIEHKNGVIILSNVSGFNSNMGNIDKLCFELMETLGNE